MLSWVYDCCVPLFQEGKAEFCKCQEQSSPKYQDTIHPESAKHQETTCDQLTKQCCHKDSECLQLKSHQETGCDQLPKQCCNKDSECLQLKYDLIQCWNRVFTGEGRKADTRYLLANYPAPNNSLTKNIPVDSYVNITTADTSTGITLCAGWCLDLCDDIYQGFSIRATRSPCLIATLWIGIGDSFTNLEPERHVVSPSTLGCKRRSSALCGFSTW